VEFESEVTFPDESVKSSVEETEGASTEVAPVKLDGRVGIGGIAMFGKADVELSSDSVLLAASTATISAVAF